MNPDELINKFIKVIQEQDYLFTSESIQQDIPSLQKNLKALENKNLNSESLAQVIREWYINHPSVRDAVLRQEREISKVKNRIQHLKKIPSKTDIESSKTKWQNHRRKTSKVRNNNRFFGNLNVGCVKQ